MTVDQSNRMNLPGPGLQSLIAAESGLFVSDFHTSTTSTTTTSLWCSSDSMTMFWRKFHCRLLGKTAMVVGGEADRQNESRKRGSSGSLERRQRMNGGEDSRSVHLSTRVWKLELKAFLWDVDEDCQTLYPLKCCWFLSGHLIADRRLRETRKEERTSFWSSGQVVRTHWCSLTGAVIQLLLRV